MKFILLILSIYILEYVLTAAVPTSVNTTPIIAVVGTYEDIATNDDNVRKALHHAIEQLNSNWTDNLYFWKVDKIFSAKRKVVAGTFYDINFEIYKSECVKNNEKLLDCLNTAFKPANDVSATKCSLVVFSYLPTEGHGTNDYKVTNTTCNVSEDC